MIRVAVVDDEVLVRSAFELILGAAGGIEVVASTDGPGALDAIVATHPDIVLLDIRMPGRTGLEVLDDIRELAEPPVVAILTTFDTDDSILRALSRGAAGFLLKDTDPEQLPALVRSLASGGVVLSPAVSRVVVSGYVTATSRPAPPALETLSERERLVLARLAVGESNAEIGRALHLSASTVKDHVSGILTKLDLTTRLQAAIIADRVARHRVDAG